MSVAAISTVIVVTSGFVEVLGSAVYGAAAVEYGATCEIDF